MKTKYFFPLLAACAALFAVGAQAFGIDIAALVQQYPAVAGGLSMLAFAGRIEDGDVAQALQGIKNQVSEKLDPLVQQNAELQARMRELEQKDACRSSNGLFHTKESSPGDRFIKAFESNRELFQKTRSVRLEIKAAGDVISTTSGRTIVSGGVGAPGANLLGLQNALTLRLAPNTTAIEYSRFIEQQGAAAIQATEGSAKAAVRPDHTLITQGALTIAGFSKMSRQAMNDSAELRRAVDTTLSRSVNTALDAVLTTGGTGFAGGFAALATAFTSLIYSALVDAISEGVATMQTAGFAPDVVAVSPADFLSVTVMKDSTGQYLSGAYLGRMPSEMRGLRVVLSPTVATGKAILVDSQHCELQIVDEFSIEVGYVGDDFTNNLATILGEMRVIPVFRAAGAARLITPKAVV